MYTHVNTLAVAVGGQQISEAEPEYDKWKWGLPSESQFTFSVTMRIERRYPLPDTAKAMELTAHKTYRGASAAWILLMRNSPSRLFIASTEPPESPSYPSTRQHTVHVHYIPYWKPGS